MPNASRLAEAAWIFLMSVRLFCFLYAVTQPSLLAGAVKTQGGRTTVVIISDTAVAEAETAAPKSQDKNPYSDTFAILSNGLDINENQWQQKLDIGYIFPIFFPLFLSSRSSSRR